MSAQSALKNQIILLESIGKPALNALYPDEFELYVCALELVDQTGKTLRYFIFPVNPSSIDENQPQINNIKKTLAGVTTLSTPTFVPVDITLTGNFGRKFKVLLGTDYVDFLNSFKTDIGQTTASSLASGLGTVFDQRTKTGYGCLKILEDLIKEASVVDSFGPRRLIFYNPAFGTSYLIRPQSFKIQMSQESNMIHNYYLTMKGVAPLDSLLSQKQLQSEAVRLNTTNYVQSETNRVVQGLLTILQ